MHDFWSIFFFFQELSEIPQKTEKCWGLSEYFWSITAIFTFDLCSVFLEWFPLFFGPFLVFRKSFKISICLLVFCLLWSANFRFVSGVWQKLIIFSLLVGFLFFLIPFRKFMVSFRFSEKLNISQFFGRFPIFCYLFLQIFGPFSGIRKSLLVGFLFEDSFPHIFRNFLVFL